MAYVANGPVEDSGRTWRTTPTRLLKALQRQGNLSASEASCLVRCWRAGDPCPPSEAVRHYGGAVKLLWDAIEFRHI